MKQFLNHWLGGRLLLALISGYMLAMCFPSFDIGDLVWIWAAPLMVALWTIMPGRYHKRKGFTLAYLCGLTFWLVNLWWLESMKDLDGVPLAGALFSWLGMSAYLAVYFGIWGAVICSIGNPWKKEGTPQGKKKKSRIEEKIQSKLASSQARTRLATREQKKSSLLSGFGTSLRVMRFSIMHAALWVMLEWLRGWLFTGFTWNGLGTAFHSTATIAQCADLVGVTGLAFLPMLVCSMMVQLGARLISEAKQGKFKAHWEIAFTIGLVSLAFVYGIIRIGHFSGVETHPVKVLILQENIPQSMKWGDDKQQLENYRKYAESLDLALAELSRISNEEAKRKWQENDGKVPVELEMLHPDIVLLPESSFTQNMFYEDNIKNIWLSRYDRDFLQDGLLAKGNFSVIYGSNLFEGDIKDTGVWAVENAKNYNSLAIAPASSKGNTEYPTQQISAYAKIHLVPFGEYFPDIPFRDAIYSAMYGASPNMSFNPGTSYEPLKLHAGGIEVDIIPAICFEDSVGRVTRKFARAGRPQMIVNLTNDGWFPQSDAARQHMANAKFRAIELRRPMVRSANTGMSGVIDITGSFKDKITKERQVIEDENGNIFVRKSLFAYARVPVKGETTLYAALGDWFVILCLILFALTIFLTILKSQKSST